MSIEAKNETLCAALDGDQKLWCILLPCTGEIYAAPSKNAAEHMAKVHNNYARSYYKKKGLCEDKFAPPLDGVLAVVSDWPLTPEEHAALLGELDAKAWGLEGGAA